MSSPRGQAAGGGQQYGTYEQGSGYVAQQEAGRASRRSSGGSIAGSALAGVLMMVGGGIAFLDGLSMVIRGGFFVNNGNYVYHWNTTNWGYTQLILGGIVFFAGVCVLLGMVWARALGVFLAGLGAIAAFLTIPFYPIWSIIMVALYVFIIWALLTRRRSEAY